MRRSLSFFVSNSLSTWEAFTLTGRRPTTESQRSTAEIKKASQEVLLLKGFLEFLRTERGIVRAKRLVFLFLLRSLLLGCHEVFSSVNFFPLQGVGSVWAPCPF